MLKKIYNALFNDEMDITERLFRIILVVGIAAVTVAILEGLTLVTSEGLMWVYGLMLASFVISFIATFRYRNMEFSSILIGIVIIVVAIPCIFFKGGGINSGSAIWMCLGICYVFLMFSGIKLVIFIALTLLVDVSCYIIAFYNPKLVVELSTNFEIHFDSCFAVIVVGLTVGTILKFQTRVFERERKINLDQKEKLEIVSKSKDSFFAGMSHEIRTPINSIIGLNELILRENPSEEIQGYAKNIQGASKMLLALVNDILDLSQLEVQRMELVEKEYSTYELFHEVIDMMQVRMEEKNLKFMINVDKDIPSTLIGDDRRIKQIMLNLLTNGAKYTHEGSVTLRAEAEEVDENQVQLKIVVADTGIGIRKEEIGYLFDAFQRADLRKNQRIEGTGLGLSITKHLLDLMGGEVTVDSIYTQGSVFTVTIKQTVANAYPMGDILAEQKNSKSKTYYSKSFEAPEARVLVIDDDDLNLIITTKLLQDTKMSIDTASSYEEALRKTKKRFYNLIFMDYMMPGMDGGEMLTAIRSQENGLCRETPVVLLSANVYADKQNELLRMGFDGLLEKPIDATKLEEETLRHIPDELIEYRRDGDTNIQSDKVVSRLMSKKRKKIYVTSDSVCDIPEELCKQLDIKIIDLYIKTKHGRFKDAQEIDINNMSMYMSEDSSSAYSLAPSVEDYEKFFAEILTEADDVIYLSMAKGAGRCYGNAIAAARGFDHVHVIDSGHISSGQALIVLHAAKLAEQGATIYHIAEEIETIKQRIHISYMIPGTQILYKKGYTDKITAKICNVFKLHPILATSNSRVKIIGVGVGSLEKAWRSYIRFYLRNAKHINNDIIFISHAGCSVRQQEIILEEINRYVKFDRIMITQSSVANVCNAGLQSMGFAIYRK